jgi:hypothetical protein
MNHAQLIEFEDPDDVEHVGRRADDLAVAMAFFEQVLQIPLALGTQRRLAMSFNQSGPLVNLFKHRFSDLLPLTDYQP